MKKSRIVRELFAGINTMFSDTEILLVNVDTSTFRKAPWEIPAMVLPWKVGNSSLNSLTTSFALY